MQEKMTMTQKKWGGGSRTSSKNHVKKLHSINVHSIIKVHRNLSARSIQVCWGINRNQCLERFCSQGKTSLHCQKVRKSLDMGEPPSTQRKLHVTDCSSKPKCMFQLQHGKLLLKTAHNALNMGSSAQKQTISLGIGLPNARELVLSP